MPNAKPTPSSATNYGYWEKYLDYILLNQTVNSGAGTPPSNGGALPPGQSSSRVTPLGYESRLASLQDGSGNKLFTGNLGHVRAVVK